MYVVVHDLGRQKLNTIPYTAVSANTKLRFFGYRKSRHYDTSPAGRFCCRRARNAQETNGHWSFSCCMQWVFAYAVYDQLGDCVRLLAKLQIHTTSLSEYFDSYITMLASSMHA